MSAFLALVVQVLSIDFIIGTVMISLGALLIGWLALEAGVGIFRQLRDRDVPNDDGLSEEFVSDGKGFYVDWGDGEVDYIRERR